MSSRTLHLLNLRRELESIKQNVDDVIDRVDQMLLEDPRRIQSSYPDGYDFRNTPEKLAGALQALAVRVDLVSNRIENFTNQQLRQELSLRVAEARIYQSQAVEHSPEWEDAVGIVRSLTRIVAKQRPGYVYGLSALHQADWGHKIKEVLSLYTPVPLDV